LIFLIDEEFLRGGGCSLFFERDFWKNKKEKRKRKKKKKKKK
jgi:hypothetical protein